LTKALESVSPERAATILAGLEAKAKAGAGVQQALPGREPHADEEVFQFRTDPKGPATALIVQGRDSRYAKNSNG
jgi:hypothetical protein